MPPVLRKDTDCLSVGGGVGGTGGREPGSKGRGGEGGGKSTDSIINLVQDYHLYCKSLHENKPEESNP